MIDTPESRIQQIQHFQSLPQVQPVPELPAEFHVYNGKLFYRDIDLMALVQRPVNNRGRIEQPTTPLYVRWLPALRDNYKNLQRWFEIAKTQTDYPGELTIAYASKANPSEPVARTVLQMGAAHECSSAFDIDVVRHAYAMGWLDQDRSVFANGFKVPAYLRNLLDLRADGFTHVIPIFDDIDEIEPFAASEYTFEVGVRSHTDAKAGGLNRFGMDMAEMEYAAWRIMNTENLTLTVFHAMQMVSMKKTDAYLNALRKSVQQYARLWRIAPTLHRFNIGGGLPASTSGIDFQGLFINILQVISDVCAEEDVPVPDLIVEPGRYMVQDHAFKLFNIVKAKRTAEGVPFYLIDGSIMSNFPDAWALGDEFRVLPINNWDTTFIKARLAGLTCDRDDIYPTHKMPDVPLSLPLDTEGLIVGFFECGAYQETLGGRNGSKHCLLPEGSELILDVDADGDIVHEHIVGQSVADVLGNLGYEQVEAVYSLQRVAL